VHHHGPLWAEKFATGLFDRGLKDRIVCRQGIILGLNVVDWMEWQAGYVSGAILMPVKAARTVVSAICMERGWHAALHVDSSAAGVLVGAVMDTFAVSEEAARIRLEQLALLKRGDGQLSLF
jgi:hypothetical protein